MNMVRRRLGAVLAVGVLGLGLVAGCSQGGADDGGTSAVEVSNGTTLSVDDFAALIADDGVVLVDVRTPQEFAEGHLEGAQNIDVEAADFVDQISGLDKDTTYAVYCRAGNRSKVAMQTMITQGFTQVVDMDGGITSWISAGQPVVTG